MVADPSNNGRDGRGLTADELDLWRRAMRDAEAWPGREPRVTPQRPVAPDTAPPQETLPGRHRADRTRTTGRTEQPAAPSQAPASLTAGRAPGLDRRRAERLRRGRMPIEGRIDLHGMTLDQAHPALIGFIQRAQAQGKRLVLVITGKGKHRDDPGPIPARRGVLKHQVPAWLRAAPLSGLVLEIREAHLRHGGSGAYYVYLRRSR